MRPMIRGEPAGGKQLVDRCDPPDLLAASDRSPSVRDGSRDPLGAAE
jgi:hypothetical protein